MIRYIQHDEIDFERWDACVDRSINGIFYAWSWFLDMAAGKWDALVEDNYKAVMPLPLRKKAGIHYVYQPFFVQQLGVFSTYSLSPEVSLKFLDAMPGHIGFVDYNLNIYNRLPEGHPYIFRKGITHELDLILPYEKLRGAYSGNTHRNIKKAHDHGVFVTDHGRPEEVIEAFRQNRGQHGVPFSDSDYLMLKHMIYAGMHRGMVKVKYAYSETNNFCAGIVFFTSHNKSVWLFSGATSEARQNGAMSLLVDDFVRENAGREMILDFEGSSDANLSRFYRGFGSKECVFLQIRMNRVPWLLKPLLKAYLHLR